MSNESSEAATWGTLEEERVRSALEKGIIEGARGLSCMLGGKVTPDTWGLLRVGFNTPPIGLYAPQQNVYSVFLAMQGDLYGTAVLNFSVQNTEKLMDRILQQLGPASRGNTDEIMRSAMEEAGNILVNGLMAGFSRVVQMEVYPSVPKLEQGPWTKSWNKLMMPQGVAASGIVLFADFSWELVPKFGQFFLSLSQSSLENLRLWALRGKVMSLSVGIGAMEIGSSPMTLKATDLGSCVAVMMYDTHQKMGGMAHVMLPRSPCDESGNARPGKYADTAVAALIKKMRPKTRLCAWLVGGADMLMTQGFISSGSIGSRNSEALRDEIKRAGVRLVGEDLGGSQARTVELFTETGELWIKWKQSKRKEFIR